MSLFVSENSSKEEIQFLIDATPMRQLESLKTNAIFEIRDAIRKLESGHCLVESGHCLDKQRVKDAIKKFSRGRYFSGKHDGFQTHMECTKEQFERELGL